MSAHPGDSRVARFAREDPQTEVLIRLARVLRHVYRVRVFGEKHIPRDGPVVYVGKHPRTWLYLETLVLGLVTFWDSGRPPFHVTEQRNTSLHRMPIVGWMRRHVHAIPATMDCALGALGRGESVLIFPGGARELYGAPDELCWRGRTGFARVALTAGVPIQPFAIIGADRQHLGRLRMGRSTVWLPPVPLPVRLEYCFAPPIAPAGDPASSGAVQTLAARAHSATRALIAEGLARRRVPRRHRDWMT